MRRRLRWAGSTLATLVAAAAFVLTATPAQAADELELSTDGSTWSTSLADVLFPGQVLVPGDVVTTELWVRNGSGVDARVELDVADALGVVPGTFQGDLSLTIDGADVAGGSRWLGPVLSPGTSARIPIVVTFDLASAAGSRLATSAVLDAALLVQAVDPEPTATPTAPGGDPTAASQAPARGALAHTGQDVAGAVAVAIAAVGAGLVLLAARRRSRRERD